MARKRGGGPRWIATGKPIATPPPVPREEIDAAIADGLLIARFSAVLALKNRLIVSALRDDLPFDRDEAARAYSEVAGELAEEQERNAEHASELIQQVMSDPGVARHEHDYKSRDVELLVARRAVYSEVARRLRSDALEPEIVAEVVEEARTRAWDEISRELTARLDDTRRVEGLARDDDYARDRVERMRLLQELDLHDLAEGRRRQARRRSSR
ncbi:hypothetical protein [Herbiconiux sp. A18JL235]|uniref:Asparagine synthase n=1 Tax=Herbiconiux sp. A18JL235 TaxID=3152363 RepID=A0AB39BCZ8_9MICO